MSHVSDVLVEEGKLDSSDQSTVLMIVSSSCAGNEVCTFSSERGTSLCKFGNRNLSTSFPRCRSAVCCSSQACGVPYGTPHVLLCNSCVLSSDRL